MSNTFRYIIMLEAIALVIIGAVAHVTRARMTDIADIVDNLILAVILGIACFALFGEPSAVTAIPYMAAGYGSSEFLDWVFKPWWNDEKG